MQVTEHKKHIAWLTAHCSNRAQKRHWLAWGTTQVTKHKMRIGWLGAQCSNRAQNNTLAGLGYNAGNRAHKAPGFAWGKCR